MKTKYDWSGVPDDVNWIATQESGFVATYKSEPTCLCDGGVWSHVSGVVNYHLDAYLGNWQDSLEERPK